MSDRSKSSKSRIQSQDFVSIARVGGGEDEPELEIIICERQRWMQIGEVQAGKIRSTGTPAKQDLNSLHPLFLEGGNPCRSRDSNGILMFI